MAIINIGCIKSINNFYNKISVLSLINIEKKIIFQYNKKQHMEHILLYELEYKRIENIEIPDSFRYDERAYAWISKIDGTLLILHPHFAGAASKKRISKQVRIKSEDKLVLKYSWLT